MVVEGEDGAAPTVKLSMIKLTLKDVLANHNSISKWKDSQCKTFHLLALPTSNYCAPPWQMDDVLAHALARLSLSLSLAEAAAYYTASPASRELECAEDIYPQQSFSRRVVLIAERSKLVARAVQFRVPE